MHILIIILILFTVIYGPSLWAKHVLKKYNKDQYFSGTGIDLARLLLDRMDMKSVRVEETELGDHYDPENRVVRLSRENGRNKSLTSVVVAAHEVGHAIQAHTGYRPLQTRNRMITTAHKMEKLGAVLMLVVPLITVITRVPAAGFLMLIGGFITLCIPLVVHFVTLPVEFDASFNRALPILTAGDYIPTEDLPAARKILMACALTYVASALASLLNIWRWIRILRR
jgi:Zn-dependent membrane protease YugP